MDPWSAALLWDWWRLKHEGDTLCHPILVPSYLQEFDVAKANVGAERNPQKTEVIYYVNDLGAASPEWRIGIKCANSTIHRASKKFSDTPSELARLLVFVEDALQSPHGQGTMFSTFAWARPRRNMAFTPVGS